MGGRGFSAFLPGAGDNPPACSVLEMGAGLPRAMRFSLMEGNASRAMMMELDPAFATGAAEARALKRTVPRKRMERGDPFPLLLNE